MTRNMYDDFNIMVKEICSTKHINTKVMSYGYVIEFEKEGRVKYCVGANLGLNSQVAR